MTNYQPSTENGLRKFLLWSLATILGWFLSSYIPAFLQTIIPNNVFELTDFLLGFTLLGFFQWLLLWRWLRLSVFWVIASGLGFGVGLFISMFVAVWGGEFQSEYEWYFLLLPGAVVGFAVGCCQSFALSQRLYSTYWWTVFSTVAWSVSFFVSQSISGSTYAVTTDVYFLRVIEGCFIGIITGICLIWVSKYSKPINNISASGFI